ncbi:MAG: hypothetical protein RTU92_06100, partial [Candidatus Thorarchaeota archaeon]
MSNSRLLQIFNLIVVIATITINALANILPINGVGTGDVANSPAYFNFFTPANWVFSIWGVIYLLLIVFAVYQIRSGERDKEYLKQIGVLFILNGIFNMVWIFIFHFSVAPGDTSTAYPAIFALSMIPMAAILITLLLAYVRLGIGVKNVPRNEKFAVHLPFSVYAGWISVAIIANTASTLSAFLVIPEMWQHIWVALVLVVALLITLLMLILRRDFAFGLVV